MAFRIGEQVLFHVLLLGFTVTFSLLSEPFLLGLKENISSP